MRAKFLAAALALAAVAAPSLSAAQLVVDRLVIEFGRGRPDRADIQLRNESADRYYITVTPFEVSAAGEENQSRETKTNPEELGLMVTPNRIVLDPGASRSLRIVSLNGPVEKDRIYRVLIQPQVGALSTQDLGADQKGVQLKILTAYEALVMVRPAGGKAEIVKERTADGLVLRNVGNSNALLLDGEACPAPQGGAKAACVKLPSHRLYVGNAWRVPLPNPTDIANFRVILSEAAEPRAESF